MRKHFPKNHLFLALVSFILLLVIVPVVIVFAATVPAEINMRFSPIAIASGGTSTLRISVFNLNGNPLTSATWTDYFPAGMTVADPPNMNQTCGGTVTDGSDGVLEAGDTSIKLSNGTVPGQQPSGLPGECYVEVDVTSTTPGNLINTIPANHLSSQTIDPDGGGSVAITNTTPASATINVIGVESPSLSKAFAPNTVFVGETSTLTITIHNNDDDYPLTEVTMFDILPTGGNGDIKVASPPNASLSGCGEGSGAGLTDESGTPGSLGADDITIKLVDGIINPGTDCVITVDVVSLVQGAYTNEIPTGDPNNGSIQTQQGVTNEDAADDSLNVQAFSIDKEFDETRIAAGETTGVSIEIVNNATIDYTGATMDDVLPGGLEFVDDGSAAINCTPTSSTATLSVETTTNSNDTLRMVNGVLPAGTTCTITATARALTSATVGTYTNDIPIGALTTDQGAINHDSTSADIEVDTLGITKVFTEDTIPSGGTSELTITITNPFPRDYTDAAGGDPLLADVLPAGFEFATTPAPGLQGVGCTGVLAIGGTNDDTLSLGDATLSATLPANSSCTITATVRAESNGNPADPGDYTNLIGAGDINTDQGATNASPTSDTISVQSLEVTKEFVPDTIPAGGISTMTIEIINNGTGTLTGANLSDVLTNPTFYFVPGTAATTCLPNGVADIPDSQTVSLTNGTISSSGCNITVDVTTDDNALPSSYDNIIAAGDLTTTEGDSNPADASDTITEETVTITKSYGTSPISYPETSTLTITISNPANGQALTNMALTDTLPVGLVIATDLDAGDTTCNDSSAPTLTGTAGTRTISLSNGSMAAGSSSCTIVVDVTVESDTVSGNYINTIGQGDLTSGPAGNGPTNGNTNSATLQVESLEVSKEFAYGSFQAGDPTSTNPMTITLTNPTGENYTNVNLSDTLPTSPDSDLEFVFGTENTDCGGTVSLSGSSPPPYRTIQLAGGTIPASSSCIITVDVTTDTGATADSYTNIIQPGDITTTVDGKTGPTVPNNVTADVDTYTLREGVEATKSFTPSTINYFDYGSSNTSRLELEFTAPLDVDLTNFSFSDVLPENGDGSVYLANPINASLSGCGASAELTDESGVTASLGSGDTTIRMINGTILKGDTCTVSVDVTSNTGTTPGATFTNTITPADVSNTEDRNPAGDVTANLTITTPSSLTMVKDFDPNIVGPEGRSRLTITLENSDTTALVDVTLDDVLPGDTSNGIVIASTPNPTTTCGSGVITFPDSQTIRMTGGTIPASDGTVNGICTINVTVQGKTTNGNSPATHTNTIPVGSVVATVAGTSSTMNPQNPASDDLTVKDLDLEIVKGFNPVLVYGGADSVMSITLRNPNNDAELIDITFTDSMPAGDMILVDPPDFDPSDCGPAAVLTRIDASTFEFSGGYLAAGEECTITLKANMTVNGNRTNTIPVGAVTTTNGATNKTATSASLTNLASVSVSKSFEPNPVASGLESYSVLTIEIRTTESVAITGLGLIDTLPTGLQVADYVSGLAPAPTNGCGGSLSSPIGGTTIQLTNGNLGVGFATCTMTIPVTGAEPGDFTNLIPSGALTNDQGITNIPATEDTLTLTPYSLGNRVWYDTNNDGIFGTGEVGVSGVRVELYRDTNNNGVYDPGVDAAVVDGGGSARFENTDGDGYYRFDDLGPDDYLVVIPGGNFTGGNPLAGYHSSGTTQAPDGTFSDSIGPDPDDDVDNDDNGKSTITSGTIDFVSAEAVTLGPNQSEPTDDDDPITNPETGEASNDQSNRTVDFGFYAIGFASHEKQLTATDQGFTITPNVAIGEILTYQSTLTVPPGDLDGVALTDTMDRGLVFDECVSITAGSTDLTTNVAGGFATVCSTPSVSTFPVGSSNPADPGRQVVFDFGTLTNSGGSDVDLVVTYQVVVLNNIENQSGISLGNQAVWSWTGGTLQDAADQVTVREPDLVFSKTVSPSTALQGQEITFTLTVDHSAATETPAYDLVLTDEIPAGLTYVPGTLQRVSGQFPDTLDDSTAPTLTVVWNQLNEGTNSVVSFNVTLDSTLRRGDRVENTASLAWTSLPEDDFDPPLSDHNPLSVERYYDPASAVNVYGLEASATIRLPGLPKTGFAPGVVSEVPSQPAEYQYGDPGDIQLIIPDLDISLPVLSIPQNDQGWDLTWLWQGAGWLEGTAYPTWTGNTVLTGHAYLASGLPGPFVNLGELSWGDEIVLIANGYRYRYQVRNKDLVSGDDVSILGHKDQDWLTLFTCKDYSEELGDYRYRQVVQAKLLDIQELK